MTHTLCKCIIAHAGHQHRSVGVLSRFGCQSLIPFVWGRLLFRAIEQFGLWCLCACAHAHTHLFWTVHHMCNHLEEGWWIIGRRQRHMPALVWLFS